MYKLVTIQIPTDLLICYCFLFFGNGEKLHCIKYTVLIIRKGWKDRLNEVREKGHREAEPDRKIRSGRSFFSRDCGYQYILNELLIVCTPQISSHHRNNTPNSTISPQSSTKSSPTASPSLNSIFPAPEPLSLFKMAPPTQSFLTYVRPPELS